MKSSELQYFVGKVCTVFTPPINRNFKEENPQNFQQSIFIYFVGIVEKITDQGLFLQQVSKIDSGKPLKTYFFLDKILGIAEEEQLDYSNPEDAAVIEKIKQKAESQDRETEEKAKIVKDILARQNSPYIDVEGMSDMAEQLKQNFS